MCGGNSKTSWEQELHLAAVGAMRKHGILGFDEALSEFKQLARKACRLQILTEQEVVNIFNFEAFRWFTVYDATPADNVWTLRKNYH